MEYRLGILKWILVGQAQPVLEPLGAGPEGRPGVGSGGSGRTVQKFDPVQNRGFPWEGRVGCELDTAHCIIKVAR